MDRVCLICGRANAYQLGSDLHLCDRCENVCVHGVGGQVGIDDDLVEAVRHLGLKLTMHADGEFFVDMSSYVARWNRGDEVIVSTGVGHERVRMRGRAPTKTEALRMAIDDRNARIEYDRRQREEAAKGLPLWTVEERHAYRLFGGEPIDHADTEVSVLRKPFELYRVAIAMGVPEADLRAAAAKIYALLGETEVERDLMAAINRTMEL